MNPIEEQNLFLKPIGQVKITLSWLDVSMASQSQNSHQYKIGTSNECPVSPKLRFPSLSSNHPWLMQLQSGWDFWTNA